MGVNRRVRVGLRVETLAADRRLAEPANVVPVVRPEHPSQPVGQAFQDQSQVGLGAESHGGKQDLN